MSVTTAVTPLPSQNDAPLGEITIRPQEIGSEADYAAMAELGNAVHPEYSVTPEEIRSQDERRNTAYHQERWLAEENGKPIGSCGFGHSPWVYHPRRFWIDVRVLPEKRRRGLGSRLYDHILKQAAPYDPLSLRCGIREDKTESLRFAARRGFTELERGWESRLDVNAFDMSAWEEARTRPQKEHGIVITTLAELRRAEPDAYVKKLWEAESTMMMDAPSEETITPASLEDYKRGTLGSLNLLPEAFFVAVDPTTGEYVGTSALWKRQADNELDTGLTAVRRDYRRRGIALALKLRAIKYAKSVNCPTIRTDNHSTNRPMLSINEALGFEKLPAWITLVKEFPNKENAPANGE